MKILKLDFWIGLVPRFAGLDIGIQSFISLLCVLGDLCGKGSFEGMTAKMEMRIRQTIRTGQKIRITGEVKKKTRKLVETYAKAELEDGTLAAEAWASMYVTNQEFL